MFSETRVCNICIWAHPNRWLLVGSIILLGSPTSHAGVSFLKPEQVSLPTGAPFFPPNQKGRSPFSFQHRARTTFHWRREWNVSYPGRSPCCRRGALSSVPWLPKTMTHVLFRQPRGPDSSKNWQREGGCLVSGSLYQAVWPVVFFLINFYWRIVALQCVSCYCIAEWISYTYTDTLL